MSLKIGSASLVAAYKGSTALAAVYVGGTLVYGSDFNPASLFANGEQGAWYEPSPTTAFRSTTDLTPCGPGDGIGFALDKSQGAGYSGGEFTGLGPELVTNGDFANGDLTGWTDNGIGSYTIDASSGSVSLAGTSATNRAILAQQLTASAGDWLLVTADITVNSGAIVVGIDASGAPPGNYPNIVLASSQSVRFIAEAETSNPYIIFFNGSSGGNFTIDNISVRELPGNHATQPTAASRPIFRTVYDGVGPLGPELAGDDFADWTLQGASVSSGTASADEPIGSTVRIYKDLGVEDGEVYRVTGTLANVQIGGLNNRYFFGIGSPDLGKLQNNINFLSLGIDGNGDFEFTVQANGSNGIVLFSTRLGRDISLSNVSVRAIPEASRRYYADFDGVDDFLATGSVDFTGSDEMSVFAGVTKTSTGTDRVIVELSQNTNVNSGAFWVAFNTINPTSKWASLSTGSVSTNPNQKAGQLGSQLNTETAVLTVLHDISADSSQLRVDGVLVDTATGDKGSGNFGNYPLYIGSRAGNSLFSEMFISALVVRGATTAGDELTDTESYVANVSGVTL